MKRIGSIQRKMLVLLSGIVSSGLSYNPRKQLWIMKQIGLEWGRINQWNLNRSIKNLYESKLIDIKDRDDGATEIVITKLGKTKSLEFKIDEMNIDVPKYWDKKWRIVIFDIPEKYRKARNAIRGHLDRMGFYKLQKSVFVFPYECEDEIDFIVEYYNIRKFVRLVSVDKIDNELHLKNIFKL
jgi:CRISPR/Cas system-associated endoribonuclease Cas2